MARGPAPNAHVEHSPTGRALTHRQRDRALLQPTEPTGRRCADGRPGQAPQEAPARTGTGTAPTSWSPVSEVSPGGAHQHEAQAQAVRNGAWSATARGSVRGPVLIANAAMA